MGTPEIDNIWLDVLGRRIVRKNSPNGAKVQIHADACPSLLAFDLNFFPFPHSARLFSYAAGSSPAFPKFCE
jgi:hypothetical protein